MSFIIEVNISVSDIGILSSVTEKMDFNCKNEYALFFKEL